MTITPTVYAIITVNEAAKQRGLDAKADMWQLPAMYVGSYAEKDAELTLIKFINFFS